MHRIKHGLSWAIILSETSHVFCCVLPTVVSILSLLAGVGLVSALPAGLLAFHEALHHWEIPLIAFSGIVLALGWGLHVISMRIDCHDTGCGHGPCAPQKNSATTVLKIATALFAINTLVYLIFHLHIPLPSAHG